MIYLDYAANTPLDPAVLEEYCRLERTFIANPNARHPLGLLAREEEMRCLSRISACLQTDALLIPVSGASEANHLAIRGLARTRRHQGRHILSTPLEHASQSGALTLLQEQGWEVELLTPGRDGRIRKEDIEERIRPDTVLVALSAVDSELGVPQPLQVLSEVVHSHGALLHLDATQLLGKLPLDLSLADSVSFAPHKFYGPVGIGFLALRKDLLPEPLMPGGESTTPFRSGTPALALTGASALALELALQQQSSRFERVEALSQRLLQGLRAIPGISVNSPKGHLPHFVNLGLAGISGPRMRELLGGRGICVSVKSACSTDLTPSRGVFAVTRDRHRARESFRISLSHLTTEQEIEETLSVLQDIAKEEKACREN